MIGSVRFDYMHCVGVGLGGLKHWIMLFKGWKI